MHLIQLKADSFTWNRWRNITIYNHLNISCKSSFIYFYRKQIRRYAIGFIEAKRLVCRPKPDCMAVMYLINGEYSWCHMTKEEFSNVFEIDVK
jgi:hypothetical protein